MATGNSNSFPTGGSAGCNLPIVDPLSSGLSVIFDDGAGNMQFSSTDKNCGMIIKTGETITFYNNPLAVIPLQINADGSIQFGNGAFKINADGECNLTNGNFKITAGGIMLIGQSVTTLYVQANNSFLDSNSAIIIDAVAHNYFDMNSSQILTVQQPAIANATALNIVAQFNTLLAELRTHGLIAT